MLDRDLPFATLAGKDSVSLTLQYGHHSSQNYADFEVELRAPNCTFNADQDFSTSTYRLSNPNGLADLLDGKSEVAFEIDALRFNMVISYMKLGIRTAYLVHLDFSTITPLSHTPWPPSDKINEYLLLDADSIGHLKFAFGCEQTELEKFQIQLASMYVKTMAEIGR